MENNDKKEIESPSETVIKESLENSKIYEFELNKLKLQSRNIFITLGLIIIISGILIGQRDVLNINLIWTCIITGILGSSTSALISALQRRANGYETQDGIKHPIDGNKEMFNQRMATFFLFRPVLGIIGGLLVYFGMQAKYFSDTGIDDYSKVIFWSLLSGLFVKSLIEKLKDLFDNLIGKK